MTKYMFVGGYLKFKPALDTILRENLTAMTNQVRYPLAVFHKNTMQLSCQYNWLSDTANIILLKYIKEIRKKKVKITGYLLVIVKNRNGSMELYKYIPKYGTLRAVRGYFRLVRDYLPDPTYAEKIGPQNKPSFWTDSDSDFLSDSSDGPDQPKKSNKKSIKLDEENDDYALPMPEPEPEPKPKEKKKQEEKPKSKSSKPKSPIDYSLEDLFNTKSSENSTRPKASPYKSSSSRELKPLSAPYSGIRISQSDVNSLQPGEWLDDNTIRSYIRYLECLAKDHNIKHRILILKPIFWEALRKCGKKFTLKDMQDIDSRLTTYKDLKDWYYDILFPITTHSSSKLGENNGLHYILCLISLQNKEIIIHDSMKGHKDIEAEKTVLKMIEKLHTTKNGWLITHAQGPYQNNGSDCGVFTLRHCQYYILQENQEFYSSEIPAYREKILKDLMPYFKETAKSSSKTSAHESDIEEVSAFESKKTSRKNSAKTSSKNSSKTSRKSSPSQEVYGPLYNPFHDSKLPDNYYPVEYNQNVKPIPKKVGDDEYYSLNMNNTIEEMVINDYFQLLQKQGKQVKKAGKILILAPNLYYLLATRKKCPIYPKLNAKEIMDLILKEACPQKFNKYDEIYWPCELAGHWVLIVIRYKKGAIELYDSMNDGYEYPELEQNIKAFITHQGLKKKLEYYHVECPQQDNDYDCGVFVMEAGRTLLHEGMGDFEQRNASEIRLRIKKELKEKKLVNGFKYTKFD